MKLLYVANSCILKFSNLCHPFAQEDDIAKAFEKIREQHGAVVNSKEVT